MFSFYFLTIILHYAWKKNELLKSFENGEFKANNYFSNHFRIAFEHKTNVYQLLV